MHLFGEVKYPHYRLYQKWLSCPQGSLRSLQNKALVDTIDNSSKPNARSHLRLHLRNKLLPRSPLKWESIYMPGYMCSWRLIPSSSLIGSSSFKYSSYWFWFSTLCFMPIISLVSSWLYPWSRFKHGAESAYLQRCVLRLGSRSLA